MKTILGLIGIMFITVFSFAGVHETTQFLIDNIEGVSVAMAAPLIVSSNITPELISEFKLKFGHIQIITVIVEEANIDKDGNVIDPAEQYQFLVKRPDRSLIKMLLPLAQGGRIDEFADKAVKNLVVGGDVAWLEDGIVYMGVVNQLKTMIQPASSFLSKA